MRGRERERALPLLLTMRGERMDEQQRELELKRLDEEIRGAAARLGEPLKGRFDPFSAPAILFTEALFYEASLLGASDIHFSPEAEEVRVEYRIDDDFLPRLTYPAAGHRRIATRLKALSGMNIAEYRLPQNGRISRDLYGEEYDLRVSMLPAAHGENIVIRLLPRRLPFTREELGFTEEEQAAVLRMLARPGLVLLTGPTGCGKSTTLACLLLELASEHKNIITVEDPAEYLIEGVQHVSLPANGRLTFSAALKDVLRQDPDVVMIGEIRDGDTAREAVRTAITGRLVLSTLHTKDAVSAVVRLRDLGIENSFLAESLSGVISERLVKRICPHCRAAYPADAPALPDGKELFYGKGCEECGGRGTKGRMAVFEVLEISTRLRNALRKGAETDALFALSREEGMNTMGENALKLLESGEIDAIAYRQILGLPAAEQKSPSARKGPLPAEFLAEVR